MPSAFHVGCRSKVEVVLWSSLTLVLLLMCGLSFSMVSAVLIAVFEVSIRAALGLQNFFSLLNLGVLDAIDGRYPHGYQAYFPLFVGWVERVGLSSSLSSLSTSAGNLLSRCVILVNCCFSDQLNDDRLCAIAGGSCPHRLPPFSLFVVFAGTGTIRTDICMY